MKTLLIFGLGYSAGHFAQQALDKGWRVLATTRTMRDIDGIELIPFDGSHPIANFAESFEDVTHIIHSIPPDKEKGDCVFHHHLEDLKRLEKLEWFSYLSTTGVYGNYDGALVNEDSERRPGSKRSIARKLAEDNWLSSGLPVHLFRLAGIYGPTRSVFNQVRNNQMRAIDKPGHVFSRIHRDDIVGVLWASIAQPHPGGAYNLCDDEPSEPYNVLKAACALLGVDCPPAQPFDVVAKTMSPMALSFWQDNKRVDNSRIKNELGYQLKYPGYHEGLKSILEEEGP